jgi:hypothetical protein
MDKQRATVNSNLAEVDDNKVVWVYAVTAQLDPGRLSGLAGVGGEPVRAVAEADLSAVVGSVDAAAFGEDSLASLLADVTSIEMIGRAHHEVVASVASDFPVVPLRLATTYPDDVTVRALLAEHRAELAGLLASLSGSQEWGVKVYLKPAARDADGGPAAGSPRGAGAAPGQELFWHAAEAGAQEIDRALSDIAIATRRHPSPYLRFGDPDGWMVLNGIYLLATERAAEFAGITQRLTEEHAALQVHVTGPWPPYSFVDRHEA